MAQVTKLTTRKARRDWKTPFLAALRTSLDVGKAAKAAHISRQNVYETRKDDPEFAKQWDDAINEALDKAEGELFRRAVKGVKKPVTVAGKRVDVTEFSDTLLQFLLKTHRPEKYRETTRNLNLNLTPEQVAALSDDDLDRLWNSIAHRA